MLTLFEISGAVFLFTCCCNGVPTPLFSILQPLSGHHVIELQCYSYAFCELQLSFEQNEGSQAKDNVLSKLHECGKI